MNVEIEITETILDLCSEVWLLQNYQGSQKANFHLVCWKGAAYLPFLVTLLCGSIFIVLVHTWCLLHSFVRIWFSVTTKWHVDSKSERV